MWKISLKERALFGIVILGSLIASNSTVGAHPPVDCLTQSTTLESLITCIKGHMPSANSEGFAALDLNMATDQAIQNAWRSVVGQMLAGSFTGNCVIPLPSELSGIYSLTLFTDNNQNYCVLMEIEDAVDNDDKVDRGWGTFIVNPNATRELSIQIAHPKFDLDTTAQGIGVFKGTNSRTLLMAGTHRFANSASSPCQPSCGTSAFLEADVAHNVNNLFHPAVEELKAFYAGQSGPVMFQFHAKAATTCAGINVYMTYGVPPSAGNPFPGDKLDQLRANLCADNPDWTIAVPGGPPPNIPCAPQPDPSDPMFPDPPTCGLNGSCNVQGRLLNNAAGNICTESASSYIGGIIHIEQDPGEFRNADSWIKAIKATWPTLDHFLCHRVARFQLEPKERERTPGKPRGSRVSLADQFEAMDFRVRRPPNILCNPADKNDEGIINPETHLAAYRMKVHGKKLQKAVIETNILVINQIESQFGSLSHVPIVQVVNPDRLLVPTAKSLTGPVDAPDPTSHNVDHYKCYQVVFAGERGRLSKLFKPGAFQVQVEDQFTTSPILFDVREPTRLCTPVDKNGEGIKDPFSHLMCYRIKRVARPRATGDVVAVPDIHVNNQFGPELLLKTGEKELCVPSTTIDLGGREDR